jgi:nitrate reductase gamma subunit
MDGWIVLASGPLFRIALLVCVLGLAYRVWVATYQIGRAWWRAGDRVLPTGAIRRATAAWLVPVRLLRARPLYSAASLLAHAGILFVPLFSLGHVNLWRQDFAVPWPTLTPVASDALAIVAAIMLAALLVGRLASRASRALSTTQDVTVLLALFALVASGLAAAHPAYSPFAARAMLLTHLLLADVVLVLTPTTKLAHCILFPFTQLTFEVGWHFPAESGRHVAVALAKENERV